MDTLGYVLGIIGFVFGFLALGRVFRLERKLKETGLLEKEYK